MTRQHGYKQSHSRRSSPRGVVLLAALVCLLIATSLVASMLAGAIRSHHQLRTERDRRQTELLLDAGAHRAAAQLASNREYQGETWNLPAASVAGLEEGRVTIQVQPGSGGDTSQVVLVTAEYPLGREFPIRRSQTFQFSALPNKQESIQ